MKVQGKLIFGMAAILFTIACGNENPLNKLNPSKQKTVSQRQAESNALAGLLAVNQANINAAAAAADAAAASNASLNAYIEVAGSWNTYTGNLTTYGGDVYISSDSNRKGSWDDNSVPNGFSTTRIIQEFDNSRNTVYYQQTVDAAFNAGKFGKIVWTDIASNKFYFCEVVFGQATLAAAKANTTVADSTKLTTTGCAGFAWSRSERQ